MGLPNDRKRRTLECVKVYCPECMIRAGKEKLLFKKSPGAKGTIRIMCRGCKSEIEVNLDEEPMSR